MTTQLAPNSADGPLGYRPVALVDLLDRVLATGVVISGDITIAIADVELVRISLRALVASVGALAAPPDDALAVRETAVPPGGSALPPGEFGVAGDGPAGPAGGSAVLSGEVT
ncbi:gas vesicle protein [Micromonospora sp. WMMD558]|uniref:gas vesicle protein n=1 Tax=Micromonospora sp. WMMD558 TaxID=3403462 RepID=UPI003BF4B805